jgi:hypothetical protein
MSYIVASPLAGVNNSVEDNMTDALPGESEGNLGFLVKTHIGEH